MYPRALPALPAGWPPGLTGMHSNPCPSWGTVTPWALYVHPDGQIVCYRWKI